MSYARSRLVLPVVFCAAALGCAPELAPLEPIRVAVLNATTGQRGSLGPAREDAARLAEEQINAAGGLFDGQPLELVFYDTETNPERAREVASDAVADGAVAVVGPSSSGESVASRDVIAGLEKPQISCCATAPTLSAADDWFFRTTPHDLLQARAVAYLAAEGLTGDVEREPCPEAMIIYRDDAYGVGLRDAFVAEYEGRVIASGGSGAVVASVSYAAGAADAGAEADLAVQSALTLFRAEHEPTVEQLCVVLISFAPDGAALLERLEPALVAEQATTAFEHGYLATDGLFDEAFAITAQGNSAKVIGTAPSHADNPEYGLFLKAHRARFGVDPVNLTSNMYDAVVLVGLAITASGSTDGGAIRDALFDVSRGGRRFEGDDYFFGAMAEALLAGEDIDYVGPSGELDFDERGDVVGDYIIWQPTPDGAGSYTIVERAFLPASVFSP